MFAEQYGATPAYTVEDRQSKTALENLAPYVSEFIGTFLLVFTARICSIVGDPLWNATAIGCMLTVLIYVFGSTHVDGPAAGGHLNPAVSFATGVAKKEPWKKVFAYIVIQLCAGLVAGYVCTEVFPDSASTAVGPQPYFTDSYAPVMIELVYTAVLAFVVLSVGYSRRNNPVDDQNHFFALAIGFVVIAGGYAGGDISGGCFNPAVAFGLDTSAFLYWRGWTFAYAGVELLGALFGAVTFLVCRREERLPEEALQDYQPPFSVRLVSEFLGTFVLVLTVGLCVVMKSTLTPWAAAAALMCMIYSLWDVSGAHFNPAVTIAVMLSRRGKCPPQRAVTYIAVQLLAGLLAGFIFADIHAKGPYSTTQFCLKPLTKVSTSSGLSENYWAPVFWAEFTFTAMLAYVVLAVATTTPEPSLTKQNFSFGFAIAACVTAGGFAIGSISGGELNPAVSLGIQNSCSIAPGDTPAMPWSTVLYFVLFEFAGAVAAVFVFAVTHSHEFTQKPAVENF